MPCPIASAIKSSQKPSSYEPSPQQLDDYIDHILAAMERIQRYYADADEVVFLQYEMLQDDVMRNFEVIGEASENVCNDPSEFAYLQPQIQ